MSSKPLTGKIALVTGASRGIGRGIAVELGEAGATVYITGRTLNSKNGMGSIEDTANEIRSRGGNCIPCVVDHQDDSQIRELFKKIETEQNGQLDILVNNAFKAADELFDVVKLTFWEAEPEIWDAVNNVGLRNHYYCTVYASRLMTSRKKGLIVNISSWGGFHYIFNCAYGIGKCALDRMAGDCSVELKKHNVAIISLWPGIVKTEVVNDLKKKLEKFEENDVSMMKKRGVPYKEIFDGRGESSEFSGRVIVGLAQDPAVMSYSGKVVFTAEYAQAHGIRDIDGSVVFSFRQAKFMVEKFFPDSLRWLANWVPGFIKVPTFLLNMASSKFS